MKVASIFSLLLVSATAFTAPHFATRAVGKAPATKAVAKKAPAKKKKGLPKLAAKTAPVAAKAPVKKAAAKKKGLPKLAAKKAPVKAAAKAPVKKAAAKKKGLPKLAAKKAPVKKVAAKKVAAKKAPLKKVTVKKVAAKKAAPKKKAFKVKGATASKPPPASKGYPSFAAKAQNFKLGGGKISGGAAGKTIVPVFVHPTVNTTPPPSFNYVEAAKARKTPQQQEYVFDDGLTVIERKQSKTIPAFLTGSARSRVEAEAPRDDIDVSLYPFGLSGDRFQLLFITLFSLFTLVGSLSGTVSLD